MEGRGEREVRAYLEAHGVRGEIRTFEESTHNAELAARELGVELGQIANTILLLVDGAPVVVVISGDRRIAFKKVQALRGGKKGRAAGAPAPGAPGSPASRAPFPQIPAFEGRCIPADFVARPHRTAAGTPRPGASPDGAHRPSRCTASSGTDLWRPGGSVIIR